MDLSPGDRIDRYVLCEPLGEGGQGAVWKAQDPLAPDAFRAIKLVSVAGTRPNDTERLRREARALARLSHPSLLKSHALFEDLASGVLGIVMDYVEGASLRGASEDPRFSGELAAKALGHVARALGYVHRAGVTHRDLKLENVLVTSTFWTAPEDPSNVKLVDFGIAKDMGAQHPLTALDTVIGTLAYLAPELIDPGFFPGQSSAPAVDVFAFGVLAYKMLVGGHPSGLGSGASIVDYAAVYRHSQQGGAPWPVRLGSGPWADLIRDCLVLAQSARLADGEQLAEHIAHIPPSAATLASEIVEVGQAPTSLASPRAVLAPTEALTAIPARAEPPVPLTPATQPPAPSPSLTAAREAPTRPLSVSQSPNAAGAPTPVPPPGVSFSESSKPAIQASAPAPAVTGAPMAAETPPPSPAGTRKLLWAAVATLASVLLVVGYRFLPVNRWLHREDQPPEPIAAPPRAPTASVTRISPTEGKDADAGLEASPTSTMPAECDAGAEAGACPCCPSGHDCGGACDEPIGADERWVLRLGAAKKGDGNLLSRYPGARICVRIERPGAQPVCTDLKATYSDDSVPENGLEVTGDDFERHGLDITVLTPNDAGRPLVRTEVPPGALSRKALCRGLVVDTSRQSEQIDRVVFYLDPPGKIPHRCVLP